MAGKTAIKEVAGGVSLENVTKTFSVHDSHNQNRDRSVSYLLINSKRGYFEIALQMPNLPETAEFTIGGTLCFVIKGKELILDRNYTSNFNGLGHKNKLEVSVNLHYLKQFVDYMLPVIEYVTNKKGAPNFIRPKWIDEIVDIVAEARGEKVHKLLRREKKAPVSTRSEDGDGDVIFDINHDLSGYDNCLRDSKSPLRGGSGVVEI